MTTFADYKAQLAALIDDAKSAVTSAAAPDPRRTIAKNHAQRLFDFANETPLDGPEGIEKLDKLANKTAHDLLAIGIGASVDAIAARAAELEALSASLESLALDNNNAAEGLALKPLRGALSTIADGVASAKSLIKSLDPTQGDQARVIDKIEALSTKFAELRAAMDKLGSA